MHHSLRAVLIRCGRILGRHAFSFTCAYAAAAVVSAIAVWIMMVVLTSIGWVGRMLGVATVLQDWASGDMNPLLAIGSGLFILPLGTMAAALFLPPVMLVAYPLAVVVVRRVVDRRRVVAIGAVTGALLAPAILAVWRYFDDIPAYRTSVAHVYGQSVPVTFLPSLAAGATIGWVVARLQGRAAATASVASLP